MASASDWDDVLGEELRASYQLGEDILACEAERTPSTCDHVTACGELPGVKPATWWAVLLKAAGTDLGYESAGVSTSQSPRLQVVSGCTGCSAESFVLKARWTEVVVCVCVCAFVVLVNLSLSSNTLWDESNA